MFNVQQPLVLLTLLNSTAGGKHLQLSLQDLQLVVDGVFGESLIDLINLAVSLVILVIGHRIAHARIARLQVKEAAALCLQFLGLECRCCLASLEGLGRRADLGPPAPGAPEGGGDDSDFDDADIYRPSRRRDEDDDEDVERERNGRRGVDGLGFGLGLGLEG